MKLEVHWDKDGNVPVGAWIKKTNNSDVHVYAEKTMRGIVLGQNKNYKDKIEFSDVAISLTNDKVTVQYADGDKPVIKELDINVFVKLYEDFLISCQEAVQD